MVPTFEAASVDYRRRWQAMSVSASVTLKANKVADTILAHQTEYEEVSKATDVPWVFVALIHYRESDLNFKTHLANGDSLKADTVHVPKHLMGRAGPFGWVEAAVAALKHDHDFDTKFDWDFARLCYQLEAYNGWGYRSKGVTSPYLWSQSNQHLRGKYVRDGVYSASAIDEQLGCLVVLKSLITMGATDLSFPDINVKTPEASEPPVAGPLPSPKPLMNRVAATVRGWFSAD